MELAKDIKEKLNQIPKNVEIVAATKYVDAYDMRKLYSLGIYTFGENRDDAFLRKYEQLKTDPIHWHFIGHLQTNKAKRVIPKIEVLHSLDSLKLAEQIEKLRTSPLDCYIEVNINQEESKHGIALQDCEAFIRQVSQYKMIHIIGLMMMTKKDSSYKEQLIQFQKLKALMHHLNKSLGLSMQKLSMGMSDDYQAAIDAGTTTIRLGRMLWDITK